MIQINLLPKEYRKKNQLLSFKKGTAYAMAAVGAVVVLMVFSTIYQTWKIKSIQGKIREAKERTEKLKKDIQLVDALTEVKQKLMQRMSAIDNLDKYRTVWIKIMEDLSSRIPAYLWLSTFKEESPVVAAATNTATPPGTTAPVPDTSQARLLLEHGPRQATLEGYCYSINSLAAFLINLTRSNYFKSVELKFIRSAQQEKQKFFTFRLGCELHYFIEPPSFAKAEQKPGAQVSPTASEPTDQTPAEETPTTQEPAGQSQIEPSGTTQTLAQKNGPVTAENQKIIP